MSEITGQRALELLTEVVAECGEDTVYVKVPDKFGVDRCVYTFEGQPSCIVGHVLVRADFAECMIDFEALNMGAAARNLDVCIPIITEQAAEVFQAAQTAQDNGDPWGTALQAARYELEYLKGMENNGV